MYSKCGFDKTEYNLQHFMRNCRIKNLDDLKEMRQTHIYGEQEF